jgi:hypothetical protein
MLSVCSSPVAFAEHLHQQGSFVISWMAKELNCEMTTSVGNVPHMLIRVGPVLAPTVSRIVHAVIPCRNPVFLDVFIECLAEGLS